MADVIAIKPHHFVDIITHTGAPDATFSPHPYGHAVHTVAERILADPGVFVRIELGADDICAPCSHNIGGRCDDTIDTSYRPEAPPQKRKWNLMIDRRWCDRLGLLQGDLLTAEMFCRRLRNRAGDITDIYREVPVERTAQRQQRLRRGVAQYLQRARPAPDRSEPPPESPPTHEKDA